jgi:hypothetical protein
MDRCKPCLGFNVLIPTKSFHYVKHLQDVWVACNNNDPVSGIKNDKIAKIETFLSMVRDRSKLLFDAGQSCVLDHHTPLYTQDPMERNVQFFGASSTSYSDTEDSGGVGTEVTKLIEQIVGPNTVY